MPFALIALVNLIPDELVLDRLDRDLASGALAPVDVPRTPSGGSIDRFGECVLTTVGVDDGSDGWFARAATSPNLGNCERLVASLRARAEGGQFTTVPKIRYWNGLSVVARPVLALAGLPVLRLLGLVSVMVGLGVLGREAHRIAGPVGAAALVGPVVVTGDLVGLVQVFHHPMMVAAAAFAAACLMRQAAAGVPTKRLVLGAAAAAGVYNVIDLFNFVPGVWLTTTGLVAVALPASRSALERARVVGAVGLVWPAAYVATWFGAWGWAALATSPGAVWNDITGQIGFRIDGDSVYASGEFGAGLRAVGRAWLDQPAGETLVVAMVVVGAVGLWSMRHTPVVLGAVAVTIAPALVAVPFMLVTNNHHEIHYWFEFRSLPLFAGLALFATATARTGRFSGGDSLPS